MDYIKILKEAERRIDENALYRKDNEEYIPVCSMQYREDTKEGIYLVRKIKRGTAIKWLGARLEDLPDAMKLAAFEPHEYPFVQGYTKLCNKLQREFPAVKVVPVKELLELLRDIIKQ